MNVVEADPPAARWVRPLRIVGGSLLGVILWLSSIIWPISTGSLSYEDSWQQVLHYGFSEGWQWGKGVIFTYGPLGFLLTHEYSPQTYLWIIAWNFIGFGTLIGLAVYNALRLTSAAASGLLLGLLLVYSCFGPIYGRDFLSFVCLWTISCGYLSSPSTSRWQAYLLIILSCVLSLAKFTFFPVFLTILVSLLVDAWRRNGWKRVLEFALASGTIFSAVWLLSGQTFAGLGAYLRSSFEISSGYSRAMMGPFEDRVELVLAGCIAMALALLVGLRMLDTSSPISKLLTTSITAVIVFIVWKHGFVRQDGHCQIFFAVVSCLACMAWWTGNMRRALQRMKLALAVLIIVLCLFASFRRATKDGVGLTISNLVSRGSQQVAGNVVTAVTLNSHIATQDRQRLLLRKREAMPELREKVGSESIAWLMNSQAIPLINGLSLHPRGVIQSYSAYTEWLANENALCFRDGTRPKFAAVRVDLTDGRFPMAEDGPALLEILSRYHPTGNYGGAILFERDPDQSLADVLGETVVDERMHFESLVEVKQDSGDWLAASIDLKYSTRGAARTWLYKSPQVRLQVEASDGKLYDYHLVVGMSQAWFLLDPLVTNNEDFARLAVGDPTKRAVRLRLHVAPADRSAFSDPIRLRIRRFRPLKAVPEPMRSKILAPALFAMPTDVTSPQFGTALYRGRTIFQLAAPGSARLRIPKGSRRLKGHFGVQEGLNPGPTQKPSLTYEINYETLNGQKSVSLLRRTVNPWKNAKDRDEQYFEVSLPEGPADSEFSIQLRTQAEQNISTTGCYWRDLRCE